MKNNKQIRDSLGLTQIEMAMVLNINRAQWSMYESGKRNLPTAAIETLAKLLESFNATDKAESSKHIEHQNKLMRKEFEAQLKENQYQQLAISRKLDATARKYETHLNALQFVQSLQSQSEIKASQSFLKTITSRASKGLEKYGLHHQAKLKSQLELLKSQQGLLRKALGEASPQK